MEELSDEELLEKSIIDRLKLKLPEYGIKVAIEEYPDDPKGYKLSHPIGAILVRYDATGFGALSGAQIATTPGIELTLINRNLRSKQGMYKMLSTVRKIITSFSPAGYSRFIPTHQQFLMEQDGRWEYGQKYSTSSVYLLGT